ncbi:MAG TPA: ADP-ribosylglycohydrolase family protein [Cyanobacteria bacterium UBA11159]|nr:ADP-ribosylglycohydrolase family protein [Cyanobacteria bacterium UBA11159]
MNNNLKDKIRGIIFGAAIGDALGFGTEWISKQQVTEKYPNGLHDYNQITRYQKSKGMEGWFPGDSTDDTDQMLCILDSLLEKQEIDIRDIAAKIHHWAITDGMGMGRTVYTVVHTPGFVENPYQIAEKVWLDSGKQWAANGAVMRTSILGIWQYQDREKIKDNAEKVSRITHPDSRCLGSCVAVCLTISSILQGETDIDGVIAKITQIVEPYHPEFQEYFYKAAISLESLDLDEGLNPGEKDCVGYTMKTLGAGFWALRHGKSYQDGILRIIHEGGDADTNAAVAGALLGAKFGYSNIPSRWVEGLVYREELDAKIERLMAIMLRH